MYRVVKRGSRYLAKYIGLSSSDDLKEIEEITDRGYEVVRNYSSRN